MFYSKTARNSINQNKSSFRFRFDYDISEDEFYVRFNLDAVSNTSTIA